MLLRPRARYPALVCAACGERSKGSCRGTGAPTRRSLCQRALRLPRAFLPRALLPKILPTAGARHYPSALCSSTVRHSLRALRSLETLRSLTVLRSPKALQSWQHRSSVPSTLRNPCRVLLTTCAWITRHPPNGIRIFRMSLTVAMSGGSRILHLAESTAWRMSGFVRPARCTTLWMRRAASCATRSGEARWRRRRRWLCSPWAISHRKRRISSGYHFGLFSIHHRSRSREQWRMRGDVPWQRAPLFLTASKVAVNAMVASCKRT